MRFKVFAGAMMMAAASALSAQSGYTIVMKMTPATGNPVNATLKTAGDKMRLEADLAGMMPGGGRGGMDASGAYMLPNAGKLTMVMPNMVNPMGGGTGFAIIIDPATMGMTGRGAAAPAEDFTVQDMGAGESIAGHPTHRYKMTGASGGAAEVWVATDIPGLNYKTFASAFGAQFSGASANVASKLPANGFALKVVSTNNGATTTMEVTQVDKSNFEPSVFEVPAGITPMDIGGMMGRGRRGGGN